MLSFFPRLTKEDSDIIAAVGVRDARWGDVRLRVFALDPFTNASYALAAVRNRPLEFTKGQEDAPLAAALELSTLGCILRGELYLGGILPHDTRYRSSNTALDQTQTESGVLAGGMLEWRPPGVALRIGGSALTMMTKWQRAYSLRPELDRTVDERTHQLRLYAFGKPRRGVQLEGQLRWTGRPESDQGASPAARSERSDNEWLATLRGEWWIGRSAGVDVGVFAMTRSHDGMLGQIANTDGDVVRVLTRSVLQLGPRVRASVGCSWDVYVKNKGPFGGAGMTLIADLP